VIVGTKFAGYVLNPELWVCGIHRSVNNMTAMKCRMDKDIDDMSRPMGFLPYEKQPCQLLTE